MSGAYKDLWSHNVSYFSNKHDILVDFLPSFLSPFPFLSLPSPSPFPFPSFSLHPTLPSSPLIYMQAERERDRAGHSFHLLVYLVTPTKPRAWQDRCRLHVIDEDQAAWAITSCLTGSHGIWMELGLQPRLDVGTWASHAVFTSRQMPSPLRES